MYTPEPFAEHDPERIATLIRQNAFGMLVTATQGGPQVSHLPFLLEHGNTAPDRLLCHMARANPHAQALTAETEALVVFQGPHAYVSPSWYASPGVPTWNFAVVHVRGRSRRIDDNAELANLLERLTQVYEASQPAPWQANLVGAADARLLHAIVGVEILITDIQAKFKLSQNRPHEDQLRVMQQLRQSRDTQAQDVAALMSDHLNPHA